MELETRFARPDDEVVAELLRRCLPGPAAPVEVVETGSSALVALTDDAAVRIARDPQAAREMLRTQQLVDHLPPLPFDVPRSLHEPVEHTGFVAVATTRLRGEPHPPGSGDAPQLRRVLDAIHSIDPAPLTPWLAVPHAFSGGEAWLDVLRDRVVPRLPATTRPAAARVVDRLRELGEQGRALNHGDLAGSNLLWRGGRVVAVLDWDLAAWCDPADDLASLASWHGWEVIHELADEATVARAALLRDSYPLQVIAFALLHERPDDEVERAVARAVNRLPTD